MSGLVCVQFRYAVIVPASLVERGFEVVVDDVTRIVREDQTLGHYIYQEEADESEWTEVPEDVLDEYEEKIRMVQIRLVDINDNIVAAWDKAFDDLPEVQCLCGSILEQRVDAWVTPTNARGNMSGGVDGAIKDHFGPGIEALIKAQILGEHAGYLPVGRAVLVGTGKEFPRFIVSTPTMEGESDDVRRTKNTALACAAAFQAIYAINDFAGGEIQSVAIPGLGSGTGRVSPDVCAQLMRIGYTLFKRKRYDSFDEMLLALNDELVQADMASVAEAQHSHVE